MIAWPTVEECLRRIAECDAEIRAWVEVRPQPPTGSGALDGLAFGAKDIFETRGLATEYGSPLYAGRKGEEDAALVAALRARGAILLGKTHTTAFASFDPAPTRNPRAPGRTPGGSSAGSAAAVAAGMAAFAIGTQTLGSILRPAAYCGVCGFKPTFGLLPMAGALAFAPSLDTAGFFTRTAAEMAELWRRFRGTALPRADGPAADFDPPAGWSELIQAAYLINRYEGARSHAARYREFGDRMGSRLAQLIREGLDTPRADYEAALAHIALMRRRMEGIFARHSFLLSPAATGPAPEGFATTGDPAANAPWTALGVPAIAVPIPGAEPPLGVQITAAWGEDDALVAFAAEWERAAASTM
ncbi:MAG TPA: amidase [Bryobacteraceae bacterium]|nr:amidase [Bryobacteraceae bacterium]